MGFGESAKNGAQRRFFVTCFVTFALSLDRFPPNFPRKRVRVVTRDIWFHIPEKFPLRVEFLEKNVFLGYKRVLCLCPGYGSRETFCDAYTLSIPWWTSHTFILPRCDFYRGMYRFPTIHLRKSSFATVSAMGIRGCGDSSAP